MTQLVERGKVQDVVGVVFFVAFQANPDFICFAGLKEVGFTLGGPEIGL
jgi:hypothetical protein